MATKKTWHNDLHEAVWQEHEAAVRRLVKTVDVNTTDTVCLFPKAIFSVSFCAGERTLGSPGGCKRLSGNTFCAPIAALAGSLLSRLLSERHRQSGAQRHGYSIDARLAR